MDTVFIKMMEKATEIQALAPKLEENPDYEWDERQGSIFWLPKARKFALFHWDNDENCLMIGGFGDCLEGAIWLPTQAQFQGMLNDDINHIVKQGGIIGCLHFNSLPEMMAMSWEQLWAALVMRVKYNKIWAGAGEDWV